MSDNDSAAGHTSIPHAPSMTTPSKRTNKEGKDKVKRARSPSERQDGVDDQPSVGEEAAVKGKRGNNGSRKATPIKKPKTGGTAGSSSSGKSGWTPEKKKELFKTVVGHPKQADFVEVAAKLGRTPVQCHDQWRQVIYPAMLKKFDEA